MFIEFLTDPAGRGDGWAATYASTLIKGNNDDNLEDNLNTFPNPSNGIFTIYSGASEPLIMNVMDVLGRPVFNALIKTGANEFRGAELGKGIYLLEFKGKHSSHNERLIIK